MIELSVSLASNGVVKVPGYEQMLRFGYTKNRGVYRLAVNATGEWEGLAIRCFWHVPGGSDPASSLVVGGLVDVPSSVTAQPGNGCVTFEGSDGTKTVTSADLRYRVSANSGTEDGTEPEPGTPAWQQLVDAVRTDATGLPGIPVTSGGNYTDPSGQQWVCDEVDLERSVRVQRVYKVEVDGENVKFVQAGEYVNLDQRGLPFARIFGGEAAIVISTFSKAQWYFNSYNRFLYLIKANFADQLNESCKNQLGKIYYVLATPIETPLTPAEIAAYKALTAYGPDTVVQASDGAGVKLVYQRDVNIAIKKLEDAIASMTNT